MTKHRGVVIRFFKVFGVAVAIVFVPYLLGEYLPLRGFFYFPEKPDEFLIFTWVAGFAYCMILSIAAVVAVTVCYWLYRLFRYIAYGEPL